MGHYAHKILPTVLPCCCPTQGRTAHGGGHAGRWLCSCSWCGEDRNHVDLNSIAPLWPEMDGFHWPVHSKPYSQCGQELPSLSLVSLSRTRPWPCPAPTLPEDLVLPLNSPASFPPWRRFQMPYPHLWSAPPPIFVDLALVKASFVLLYHSS